MSKLAAALVDIYFQLNFVTEDYVEFQWGADRCADIRQAIEKQFSDEERTAIRSAAAQKLSHILRDPDKGGHISRSQVTPEMREFLEAIAAGRFDGSPEMGELLKQLEEGRFD